MQPPRYSARHMPTISAFMASDAFIRGLMGPVGGGKSSACVWDIIDKSLHLTPGPDGVRRARWVVVRNSYRQLRDTTIKTFHQWFPPVVFGDWRPSEDRYVMRSLRAADDEPAAEIEILFRALDRPDQVGNLLSLEVTGGWVNEAREVPWSIIDALQGRVGRYPAKRDGGASWSGIIMDTNPPDVDSRWYKFFEEKDLDPKFAAIFKQPPGRSPLAENLNNLPAGYYDRLIQGKDPEWIKVYVDGEYGFTLDGKPVFPEYSDTFHCRECVTVKTVPIYRGYDFGLTPACTFSQMTPTGQWIVVDELVSDDMGIDRFSDEVLEHSSRHFPGTQFIDVGDPAGAQRAQTDERTCFQILHAKGVRIEPGMQTLAIRLESVRKPLRTLLAKGVPQFAVHPRCKVLRKALMGGYQYRRMQVSGERFTDAPDKNDYSHVMDSLEYVGTRLFGPSIAYRPVEDDAERDWRMAGDMTRSTVTGY